MEQSPSERDRLADERDRRADARDRDADQRDRDADERDRQADRRGPGTDRNVTTGQEPADDPAGAVLDDGRFGVDLGPRDTPVKATAPEVVVPPFPAGHRGKSLTQRLADAALDREGAGRPSEDDIAADE
jgi:hypothetical protein